MIFIPRPAPARTSGAALVSSANVRFVDRLHRDLLGRAADAGEQAFYGKLLHHGCPRRHVVLALLSSRHYGIRRVQGLFRTYLGRPASILELPALVNHLTTGGEVRDLKAQLLGSAEYYEHRAGGTAAGYLAALFHDVLGRRPDPTEEAEYGRQLSGGPSAEVVREVLGGPEADAALLQTLARRFLDRPADPHLTLPDRAREEAILGELLGSDEYFARC